MLSAFEVPDESDYSCIWRMGIRSISTVNLKFNGQNYSVLPLYSPVNTRMSVLPHNPVAPTNSLGSCMCCQSFCECKAYLVYRSSSRKLKLCYVVFGLFCYKYIFVSNTLWPKNERTNLSVK
jgi:hypothetical protein